MSHDSEALRRFEKLVADYGHVIRTAVRSVAGPEAAGLAEDVEQSVLVELWKQVRREQIIDYPSSYLYRAAVRETIRLVRRHQRRAEEELMPEATADPAATGNPERQAIARELSERLRRATAELLDDRRTAVVAHLAGYRVREIMEAYDWSYNRTRNLIARGIADLRRALENDDDGE